MDISLNAAELEVLLHRLEVPDCIADCLEEDIPDSHEAIQAEAERLEAFCAANNGIPRNPTPLQSAILHDCVEDECLLQLAEDECGADITPQKLGSIRRAYRTLADKLDSLG